MDASRNDLSQDAVGERVKNGNLIDKNSHFDVLLLGPGSVNGFMECGSLHYLVNKGIIKNIKHLIGCSVGALIGLLFLCGYDPVEILVHGEDVMSLFSSLDINSISIEKIMAQLGLLDTDNIRKKIEKLVMDKFKCIPTFKMFKELTGVEFCCVASTKQGIPVYFNANTYPNTNIIEAAMYSANILGLFYKKSFDGKVLFDGASNDPYPILYYDNGLNKILGIYIDGEIKNSISDYLLSAFYSPIRRLRNLSMKAASKYCTHLRLTPPERTSMTLTDQEITSLYVKGYKTAELFFGGKDNPISNKDHLT